MTKNRTDSSVGLMFPASILVGYLIGHLLDKIFNTDPVLMIIFVLYGIAAAFINLFKHTKTRKKEKNDIQ